jgi:hypothetical protein
VLPKTCNQFKGLRKAQIHVITTSLSCRALEERWILDRFGVDLSPKSPFSVINPVEF